MLILLVSCKNDNINDTNKRNDKWAWWIDEKTGSGEWIALTDNPTWQNGNYTKFYSSGTIYQTGKIKNGLPIDTTFSYDINGNLKAYHIIKSDTTISYFLNNGVNKIYRQDGSLEGETFIENHTFSGRQTSYYRNGNKEIDSNLSNDIGWVINYYDNGQKKDSSYFFEKDNGLIEKEWYDNGNVKMSTNSKNGIQEGILINFYENGQMKDSAYFANDIQQGVAKHWRENGKIQYRSEVKDGKKNGRAIEYYENGIIKVEVIFNNGIQLSKKQYDETGKLISK